MRPQRVEVPLLLVHLGVELRVRQQQRADVHIGFRGVAQRGAQLRRAAHARNHLECRDHAHGGVARAEHRQDGVAIALVLVLLRVQLPVVAERGGLRLLDARIHRDTLRRRLRDGRDLEVAQLALRRRQLLLRGRLLRLERLRGQRQLLALQLE